MPVRTVEGKKGSLLEVIETVRQRKQCEEKALTVFSLPKILKGKRGVRTQCLKEK